MNSKIIKLKCKTCGKVIESLSEKQARHNMIAHEAVHTEIKL